MKKIRIGGVNEHFNLPWIKLAERNSLKDASHLMQWISYEGGTGVLTSALRNGEIDLAVMLTEGLILDILEFHSLQFINFHVMNPLRWAVHIRKSDHSFNFDYKGKRFAISRIGSGSHTMAKFLLVKKNISLDEVSFVEVGSLNGGLQALQKDMADVFLWEKFTTDPFLEKFTLSAYDEVLTPWPPFSVAVSKSFAKENQEQIRSVLKAVNQEKEKILLAENLIQELENRWSIKRNKAKQWIREIKWNDYSTSNVSVLDPVIIEMKNVGLIDSSAELLREDYFQYS